LKSGELNPNFLEIRRRADFIFVLKNKNIFFAPWAQGFLKGFLMLLRA
jgi:hypothetical protein